MIQNYGPVTQALFGTLFTWGLTALGAGTVIMFTGSQRKLLDTSLGFAGGVMTAASYWSLLAPAIEMAEESKLYGENGQFAFAPVTLGFLIGALFVYGTDLFISTLGVHYPHLILVLFSTLFLTLFLSFAKLCPLNQFTEHCALSSDGQHYKNKKTDSNIVLSNSNSILLPETTTIEGFGESVGNSVPLSRRRTAAGANSVHSELYQTVQKPAVNHFNKNQWKRILLLIVAITVHNIPEGLAVGVGFGAIGNSPTATFENARCGVDCFRTRNDLDTLRAANETA